MKNKKSILVTVLIFLLIALAWFLSNPKQFEQLKRVQRFQDAMSSGFEYYGRVIDQNGAPVSGAEVTVDWAYFPFIPNGDFGPNYETLNFTTDSDGRFTIKKSKGMSLAFSHDSIKKEGYEIDGYRAYMFSSGGYKMLQSFSDPANPVIFHAWKKAEAERLYYGEIFQKLPQDGQYHSLNIPALKNTMKVAFTIDPNGNRSDPLDWTVKLKIEGGGVIETSDTFMNQAPEEGYTGVWSASHRKGEKGFSRDDNNKFYFTALNGAIYGRMEVTIRAYYGHRPTSAGLGYVGIKYWLNPNGSRNLQYDPSKRIRPR